MDKKERRKLLKNIAGGPEYRALEDLFEERKDLLKKKAIQEDEDIAKVIGCKNAIDNLDRILKTIEKSRSQKSNKSVNKYAS